MASFKSPYRIFEWTFEGNIVSPDGFFLAGAARVPTKKEAFIEGRTTWRWYQEEGQPLTVQRHVTLHSAAWMLVRRWDESCQLLWHEGHALHERTNPKSIRHWLNAELRALETHATREIDVVEAAVQVCLGLSALRHFKRPSWQAPSARSVH